MSCLQKRERSEKEMLDQDAFPFKELWDTQNLMIEPFEIDDDFSYITELGYCCWTKKEVQLDMRYYYPNTHYKLAKVKVYLDDLVLLDNNDESSNGRYGEIRCSYFEIIEIFDAIELLSPRECITPENTD